MSAPLAFQTMEIDHNYCIGSGESSISNEVNNQFEIEKGQ